MTVRLPDFTWSLLCRVLTVSALFGLLAIGGVLFTRGTGQFAAVWLPNGLLLAALLRTEPRNVAAFVLPAIGLNIAANFLGGDTLVRAAGLSMLNMVEVLAGFWGLRAIGVPRPDMSRLQELVKFVIVCVVIAPMISAAGALAILQPGDMAAVFDTWWSWTLTDGLGMLTVGPSALILMDAWENRRVPSRAKMLEGAAIVLAATGTTIYVFFQTRFPFLFLDAPIVLLYAFRLGSLGTAIAIINVTIVASIATALGYGPVNLVRGDFSDKMMVLQVFLATSFGLGLPVAALLAGYKRLQEDLRRTRELARNTISSLQEVVFRTDLTGHWQYLNPAWTNVTGYDVEACLGKHSSEFVHPDDIASVEAQVRQVLSGELDDISMQVRYRHADGTFRCTEFSARLVTSDSQPDALVGHIRDITEQVQATAELVESRRVFRTLAQLSPAGIFRTNAMGECTYCNTAWQEIAGLSESEAMGSGWARALHPDEAEATMEGWALAVFRKENYRSEIRFVKPDGTSTWTDVNAAPEFDENGEVLGYIGVTTDISDQKELLSRLIESKEQTEAAAKAKSGFLANMSHEIRTPMNGVLGFTELLLDSDLNGEQRKQAQMIADSGRSMMRLLNDILDISKIEAGRISLVNEPVNLPHVLKGSAALMGPIAAQNNVPLQLDIDPATPIFILSDGLRLKQILTNLLSNASKFTRSGHIALRASVSDMTPATCQLRLEVEDTGPGIAADRLEAIFEAFEQEDDTTVRSFGGTGLGLAISGQLARLMGGEITVKSELGQGSTFTVSLPVEITEPPIDAADTSSALAVDHPGASGGASVLLVEDHDVNQVLAISMLEKLGHQVELARNGAEAVLKLDEAQRKGALPDIVLMDLQMPVMDGITATTTIRSNGIRSSDLPIIALTANAYAEDIERCHKAGMQDHLAKPFTQKTLKGAFEKWVKAPTKRVMVADATAPAKIERAEAGTMPVAAETSKDVDAPAQERPAVSPVKALYAKRRAEALNGVSELLRQGTFTDSEVVNVVDILHKLAGTAGMFGESELGNEASVLENELKNMEADQRVSRVPEAAVALLRYA